MTRGVAELAVADRQRQHVRRGADRAGLVDQRDVRRMGQPRDVAGGRRRADADEADVVVLQRAARGDGHHLVRGEQSRAIAHAAFLRCLTRAAKSSGDDFHDVLLHPGGEAVAVGGDLVPFDIGGVVADIVAVRVGRMRAARHHGNGGDRPGRQDAADSGGGRRNRRPLPPPSPPRASPPAPPPSARR